MKSNDSPRPRALRLMIASLLSSDLTQQELRKLASEMDSAFLNQLSKAIKDLTFNEYTRAPIASKQIPVSERLESKVNVEMVERIYGIAKGKKLGRARIQKYIQDINNSVLSVRERGTLPPNQLIHQFVSRASPEEARKLLGRVAGNIEEDLYLTGITNRRLK